MKLVAVQQRLGGVEPRGGGCLRVCGWLASNVIGLPVCIEVDTTDTVKLIAFLGDSLARLRDFPDDARSEAGYQLSEVQRGNDPGDWKPMKTVGAGVREIRVREASGAFRVIYLATLADRILVLHAFHKKTQRTPQKDIELAARRLREFKE